MQGDYVLQHLYDGRKYQSSTLCHEGRRWSSRCSATTGVGISQLLHRFLGLCSKAHHFSHEFSHDACICTTLAPYFPVPFPAFLTPGLSFELIDYSPLSWPRFDYRSTLAISVSSCIALHPFSGFALLRFKFLLIKLVYHSTSVLCLQDFSAPAQEVLTVCICLSFKLWLRRIVTFLAQLDSRFWSLVRIFLRKMHDY